MTQGLLTEGHSLDINVDHGAERAFVRLHGRLGIDSSPTLRERLLAILQGQPPKSIVVDLTEVSYIDASGIATLLEALRGRAQSSSDIVLEGAARSRRSFVRGYRDARGV